MLVEWEKEQQPYPAYIIERIGTTRYRVHFDGYDSRWDEDVSFDRILGRVEGPVAAPPPPPKVARAAGVASPQGVRQRRRGRGQPVHAKAIACASPGAAACTPPSCSRSSAKDRFDVHYEGHELAWDEVVGVDRILGRR